MNAGRSDSPAVGGDALVGRSPQDSLPEARYVEHVMGTAVTLVLRGRHTDDVSARAAWGRVVASLRDADEVFSTYRADSFISRLARGETHPEDGPPEVAQVLALAERARRESCGAFAISWTRPDGTTVLDPCGIVKGWAVERAVAELAHLEMTDYCLSAGGDLVCHVAGPDSPGWTVGIEDPLDPTRLVAVVPVRDGAVATSGSAHRGAHVVDPRTGRTPTALASVTVVADSLTWADVDATAGFVLGHDAPGWLATRHRRRGVLVWQDGRADTYG